MDYKLHTISGDTTTPIALFNNLTDQKVLFESSAKHEESGRYSFIAAAPLYTVIGEDTTTRIQHRDGSVMEHAQHSIDYIKNLLPKLEGDYPFPFFGGAIGYIGYETIFTYEAIGNKLPATHALPDTHLLIFDNFIVFDHREETITFVAVALEERTETQLQASIDLLMTQALTTRPLPHITEPLTFTPAMAPAQFKQLVTEAKQAIVAGEVFQVVLSQKFTADFTGDAFSLYRKLRTANPSPYMFYLAFGDYTVLGTSPESLVKVTGNTVITNPIAGTRPRGKTAREDETLARELLADDKELAEHKMLIDLSRNDIGKIANIGTVEVSRYAQIEKYQHVMHIVSEVRGQLLPHLHALDALMACLPAGTVSGAPKVRAMQLINELESERRGVYAGAVGYLSVTGAMDFALAIRTMVIEDGTASVQAGAGIVYDSDAQKEYEETLHKAKALLEVIQ